MHVCGKVHLCKAPGCTNSRSTAHNSTIGDYCTKHNPEYEHVKRIKRDRSLREQSLDVIAARQKYRCAAPHVTSEVVVDGQPTNLCPWGDRAVPRDMQQLDHIVPYSQTRDDRPANLQMLCGCCHAYKTMHELRAHSTRALAPAPAAPEEEDELTQDE